LNRLLHNLAQNLNTPYKKLPTSQYGLGFKYPHAEGLMNQSIQEEIKSRLKSGNACYNLVQNLLPSSLLSKNLKVKIYKTKILPVVLYGCETWSLTLREEHRLRVFENGV